ncbi:histidine kinase [Planotetraspora phitsanulokensis]|uniref:histidine kinase n=1 Tax=Planotetraspora phitsanulokensis TaxID=575192 RepID=A0A8J3U2T7_9ACTN|nr:histidine kinase [Planotetraspora phitsanulokensis]GII37538.1 two-component sensor histidine kinase [Planotetraspora phitsanulokensis]
MEDGIRYSRGGWRGFADRHREGLVDVALAAAVLVCSLPPALLGIGAPASWVSAPRWFAVLTAVVASLSMLVRRRMAWPPLVAAVICLAATGEFLPLTVAAYSMTAHATVRRWERVAGAAAVAYLAISVLARAPLHLLWADAIRAVALVYLPAMIGTWVRGYRTMQAELWLREERAASDERRRLAGELHDTVTHAVTVMVLHAGVIRDTEDRTEVRSLARIIEDKGVRALSELRELLTVVRRGDIPAAAKGVDSIPQLVDECVATGLRVDLRLDTGTLSREAGHACYRIVQEGLNNVRKHAPGSEVRVVCETAGDVTRVSVINGETGDGPSPAGMILEYAGPGYGLEGLKERVALMGGLLAWAPTEEGGFVLTARIPRTRELGYLPPVRRGTVGSAAGLR